MRKRCSCHKLINQVCDSCCGRSFKDHLREVRESLGMSQSELGSEAGLLPSAINHFEAGRREPNIKNLVKLAKTLRVTTDRLLFGITEV